MQLAANFVLDQRVQAGCCRELYYIIVVGCGVPFEEVHTSLGIEWLSSPILTHLVRPRHQAEVQHRMDAVPCVSL
jgi:hypothetical protein